ncbi:hypothetical protein EVAR_103010_1 [Eumeta japonica]|uniref:Uncharacterized protein n=1 Tax=Eumeta variegata TaxID=151549 RepID=A0A4C1WB93_EUMVA|nr:hypothetical protein EVAR_103010_1 [Eumeta japonica]
MNAGCTHEKARLIVAFRLSRACERELERAISLPLHRPMRPSRDSGRTQPTCELFCQLFIKNQEEWDTLAQNKMEMKKAADELYQLPETDTESSAPSEENEE